MGQIETFSQLLEALRAARVARGFAASSITVRTETTDSSGTTNYGVLMIPRRPQPKAVHSPISPTTPKSRATIVERIVRSMRLWRTRRGARMRPHGGPWRVTGATHWAVPSVITPIIHGLLKVPLLGPWPLPSVRQMVVL